MALNSAWMITPNPKFCLGDQRRERVEKRVWPEMICLPWAGGGGETSGFALQGREG